MRAMLCKAFGPLDDLTLETLPTPAPGPGEVRLKVAACGVNFPDVLIVQGNYTFTLEPPFAPGGEVAGTVAELGAGDEGLPVGAPVVAPTLLGRLAQQTVPPPARLHPRPPTPAAT